MAVDRPTFHESWHRVADLKPRLRSSTRFTRQVYRGTVWHILEDPSGLRFFRASEAAYRFIGLLDGVRTVAQAWNICNEHLGDDAPTQGEVIQLLGQLFSSNLIAGETAADAGALFRRQKKRIGLEVRSYLMSVLFLRIPLWDPDSFLTRWLPLVAWLFTPLGFVLWLAVLALGGYHLIGRGPQLADQLSGILATDNLLWLYATFFVIKLLHELGHAFACKAFGKRDDDGTGAVGSVHAMGVMFMVFLPVAYVDASSSWGLRRKLSRIVVSSAGIIAELAVAAIAAIIWARSAEGTLAHSLAYNAMFLAGVSTLVFNGNPLMRYDGYYILADLIEIPNLAKRSQDYINYLVKRFAWGVRRLMNPAHAPGERFWLPTYWAASLAYRVIVYIAIILFIADQQFVLGAVLLGFIAAAWLLMPLGKFVRYLAADPELSRTRGHALLTSAGALVVTAAALGLVPMPDHLRVEGVVEPDRFANVFAAADGWIERSHTTGTDAPAASTLTSASNPELDAALRTLIAEQSRLRIERRAALDQDPAQLQRLDESLAAVTDQRRWVEESIAGLDARAPMQGTWIAPALADRLGSFVRRGEPLGVVADLDTLILRATAEQQDAARLIDQAVERVEIRPRGRPADLSTGVLRGVFPAGSQALPSPALGFLAGGSVAQDPTDNTGQRAAAPVFEVRIALDRSQGLLPGQRAVARFQLPSRPLAVQAWNAIRRVMQERFRI